MVESKERPQTRRRPIKTTKHQVNLAQISLLLVRQRCSKGVKLVWYRYLLIYHSRVGLIREASPVTHGELLRQMKIF